MQWLVSSRENYRVQHQFGGQFPLLAADQALLEGAYTPPKHRGKKIMARAMAIIAERAQDLGARHVITFVAEGSGPSIKGCIRAGFTPYISRHESWRLLHRKFTFMPLSQAAAA